MSGKIGLLLGGSRPILTFFKVDKILILRRFISITNYDRTTEDVKIVLSPGGKQRQEKRNVKTRPCCRVSKTGLSSKQFSYIFIANAAIKVVYYHFVNTLYGFLQSIFIREPRAVHT